MMSTEMVALVARFREDPLGVLLAFAWVAGTYWCVLGYMWHGYQAGLYADVAREVERAERARAEGEEYVSDIERMRLYCEARLEERRVRARHALQQRGGE